MNTKKRRTNDVQFRVNENHTDSKTIGLRKELRSNRKNLHFYPVISRIKKQLSRSHFRIAVREASGTEILDSAIKAITIRAVDSESKKSLAPEGDPDIRAEQSTTSSAHHGEIMTNVIGMEARHKKCIISANIEPIFDFNI